MFNNGTKPQVAGTAQICRDDLSYKIQKIFNPKARTMSDMVAKLAFVAASAFLKGSVGRIRRARLAEEYVRMVYSILEANVCRMK